MHAKHMVLAVVAALAFALGVPSGIAAAEVESCVEVPGIGSVCLGPAGEGLLQGPIFEDLLSGNAGVDSTSCDVERDVDRIGPSTGISRSAECVTVLMG